ncbi:hypothetical protein HJG60_009921 [Phyllostomus discolor]|uniref:Uncharacterized protein n=1 Tax=Phyllostomus discolor TaxID=89673 RepID=A0A834EQ44_9CHIR|nr:hypothetical protein HJG60_009921 [Phyllostomus discolor]
MFLGGGAAPKVSSANGLGGLATPSPCLVQSIVHQGFHQPKQEHGSHSLQRFSPGHPGQCWCHLDSTSSDSSCRTAGCLQKVFPHHLSCFQGRSESLVSEPGFGEPTIWFMAMALVFLEHLESSQNSSGIMTCDLSGEAISKQPCIQ